MACKLGLLVVLQGVLVLDHIELKGHDAAVYCVRFSPDGKRIYSGGGDGTIRVWDPETGKQLRFYDAGRRAVHRMAFTADRKKIYIGDLIYVGPCHQVGDTIIHLPKEGVVFAGDVVFRQCTPMGWTGSYDKWFKCLDLITELNPAVIVPGHGPLCGLEGVRELKEYLQYVRDESRTCFGEGLTALDAAKRIEFGPYGEWRAPARLYMNVERAYREFRDEAPDAPWDAAKTFDAIYEVAKAKGVEVEY